MKYYNSRNILSLFVILAVGCLFAIAYIGLFLPSQFWTGSWYHQVFFFVYLIFIGAGIFFGLLSILRSRVGNIASKRAIFGLLICCLAGMILALAVPIQSPTFTPRHVIQIVATGEKTQRALGSEVWLYSIDTKKRTYQSNLQRICRGDWELRNNALVSYQNQPTSIVCELIATDYVKVQFGSHEWSGIVKLTLDQHIEEKADLFSINGGDKSVTFPVESVKDKRLITVNLLFTLASGLWIGLLTYAASAVILTSQVVNRAQKLIEKPVFQKWFLGTTNMYNKVIIVVVGLSFFATACLFFLPSIMKDSTDLKLKTESVSEKPNIILIVVDAVTAEDMSLYGYSLPTTPNLESITSTWTVYSNAISPFTCSIGLIPALLTGRYIYHNGRPNYRIGDMVYRDPNWVDISLLLKKDGYETWQRGWLTPGFTHLGYGIDHFGNDDLNSYMHKYWLQPEGKVIKSPYFPYMPLYLKKFFPASLTRTDLTPKQLHAIFKSHRFKEPWFLYYHYSGAHGPTYYSPDTLGTFLPVEEGFVQISEKEKFYGKYDIKDQDLVDKVRLRYDEAVLQQDKYLADTIKILKMEGLYDSSMIIITADHGQNFSNGYSPQCTPLLSYPEIHIPLLVKYPYQTTGKHVDAMVSTIDLTPTFLDVAGIAYDPEWFDGKTLIDASNNPQDRVVFVKSIHYSAVSAINSKWKLTYRDDGTYLFDYHNDPQEKHNMIEEYGDDSEVITLKNILDRYVEEIKLVNERGIP